MIDHVLYGSQFVIRNPASVSRYINPGNPTGIYNESPLNVRLAGPGTPSTSTNGPFVLLSNLD
jgi:hypothetical protein